MSRQLDNYVRASIPEPYRILGVQLRPFSLGSYFLMQRFDVAFASENPNSEGGITDLLMAVAICSRTYEEFLEFINDKDEFESWSKAWGKEVRRAIKKDKNFNFLHKVLLFQQYMKDGVVVPKYFEGDNLDSENESGAHWTQSVLQVLVSEIGYTHSEALNMPLSKALADYFKWAEKEGMVCLMKEDELEILEQMETANGNQS